MFFVFNVFYKGGNDDFYNFLYSFGVCEKVREVRVRRIDLLGRGNKKLYALSGFWIIN